jgi:glycosyltransferase involved in cell wall biosynthesis
MNDSPDVSVVMSVYNDAAYLRDSIESILRQEGVSFEFIVIDDGSTDGSGAMLDEYAAKDSRLRVVHQENQGLTRALITGCSMVRGRYIARQDSDDISLPGRLRRLAIELDSYERASVVASSSMMMGPRGEYLFNKYSEADRLVPEGDTFCHGSLMFRRDSYERIGGYRSEFRAAQDVDLQLRLAEVGQTPFIPEVLYAYRVNEDSISARSPIQRELSKLATKAQDARRGGQGETQILAEAARLSTSEVRRERSEPGTGNYFIGRCLYAQRDRRALAYLWASCKARPFSLRCWLALAQAALLTRSTRGHDVTLTGIVPCRSSLGGRSGRYVRVDSPTF